MHRRVRLESRRSRPSKDGLLRDYRPDRWMIAAQRGAPQHPRMGNGPNPPPCETGTASRAHTPHTPNPLAPRHNSHTESLNSRPRDECPNSEDSANPLEARVVINHWRTEHNHHRPHRPPDGPTPAAHAEQHNQQHPGPQTGPRHRNPGAAALSDLLRRDFSGGRQPEAVRRLRSSDRSARTILLKP